VAGKGPTAVAERTRGKKQMNTQHDFKALQDFKAFIAEIERIYNSQPRDLTSWDTDDLMATFVLGELQLIETIARATDNDQLPCGEIIARAYALIVRAPKWLTLWALWKTSKSVDIFDSCLQILLIRDDIWREMLQRAQGPIGRALMCASSSLPEALLKVIRLDSVQGKDVRQDIALGALHIFDKLRKGSNPQLRVLRLSPSESALPKLSGPRWSDWPDIEAQIANEILGFLDLVLSGKIERLSNKVRDSYCGQLRTAQARARIFDGKEKFPKDGPDYSWAGGDWSKKARESRHSRIEAEVHPAPEERIRNSLVSAQISAVLMEAKKKGHKDKRWAKIGDAIQYYLEIGNQEEACRRAGITPRTLQNYCPKIQKIFASKK